MELIVHEKPYAPRVVELLLALFEISLHVFAEFLGERVAERPPPAVGVCEGGALHLEPFDVGRLALQENRAVRAVGYGVEPPAAQAFVGDFGVFVAPVVAVFPENVRGGEVVGLLDSPLLVVGDEKFVFRGIEEGERVVLLGEVFKVEFSAVERRYGGRGRHPHHAVRPEQVSVGIHEPPFAADFFGSEMPRGLALSARRPAPEPVAVYGAGVSRKLLPLLFGGCFEVAVKARLARPFPEFELPVFVHKREKFLFGHVEPCRNVGGVVLGGGQRIEFHGHSMPVDELYFFDFRIVRRQARPVASPERACAHSLDFCRHLRMFRRARVLVYESPPLSRGELHRARLQEVGGLCLAVANLKFQFQGMRVGRVFDVEFEVEIF